VPVRIFVADDHDVIRKGIRSLLRTRPEWTICGEAGNGKEAIEGVKKTQPDLAILDISMPELSGLEAAKSISNSGQDVKMLVFTTHDSESLVQASKNAGAKGLVLKSLAAQDLIRAIDAVLSGGVFFDRDKPPTQRKIGRFGAGILSGALPI
jgi:DNA-binding NarL/FixJ family response regulator